MGILDEAIREHLELKRDHGAEESEIKGLEAEAFGPADRPDATSPETEAETQIISPGSSLTAPAGEGDQLDKVFEATRRSETAEHAIPEAEPSSESPLAGTSDAATSAPEAPPADPAPAGESADPTVEEHRIPIGDPAAGPSEAADAVTDPPEAEAASAEPEPAAAEPEAAPAASGQPEPDAPGPAAESGDDAGDALEAERQHLASHPTEHYDVDAAIAEEDEIDVLSESSLSDELDRALDGPDDPGAEPEIAAEPEFEPEFESTPDEGDPETPVPGPAGEAGGPDELAEEAESDDDAEDVLEETPDFLEETPEHDKLWFEQKEPEDFDFGD